MSRFTTTLVAAAAAAIAAIAVVALPAIGDDSNPSPPRVGTDADFGAFVACLRAHGLPGAPSDPVALKPWLAGKEASDGAAVKAAMIACKANVPDTPGVDVAGPDIEDVIACVRSHGIDAPSDPAEFKPWLAHEEATNSDAVHAALVQCKIALDPGPKPGAGKPPTGCDAPADKPPPADEADDAAAERST
jgi:hypothetical protein